MCRQVRFSENKNCKKYMARISSIFDSLQSINHPNIVGFHKYWFDQPDKTDKPRVRERRGGRKGGRETQGTRRVGRKFCRIEMASRAGRVVSVNGAWWIMMFNGHAE